MDNVVGCVGIENAQNVPAIWTPIAILLGGLCLLATLRQARRFSDVPTVFVIVAIWLRLAAAPIPGFADPTFGPISVNAALSLAVTVIGLCLIDMRLYRLRYAAPIFFLLFIILLSGLSRGVYRQMIDSGLRYTYLIIISILVYRAVRLYGVDPVLRAILWAMAPVIVLQFAAIPLGIVKLGCEDGSRSYIATYFHESVHSYLAFGIMAVASLIRWRNATSYIVIALLCLTSIFLANYRSTIVGLVPIIAAGAAIAMRQSLPSALFPPLVASVVVALFGALLFHDYLLPERYADIGRINQVLALVAEPPRMFSNEDKALFNSRVYLWSLYLHQYFEAKGHEILIGFGPASWEYHGPIRTLYPHNTLISWLHQFGLIGLTAIVGMLGYYLWVAASGFDRVFALRLSACFVGFYMLNFAGEPLYGIEGLLVYSILLGVAWAVHRPVRARDYPSDMRTQALG
jgi:hypothetical protein